MYNVSGKSLSSSLINYDLCESIAKTTREKRRKIPNNTKKGMTPPILYTYKLNGSMQSLLVLELSKRGLHS
jgi:hypothetical protein